MGDVVTKFVRPLDTCIRECSRRCLDDCQSECQLGCCRCSVVTHHHDGSPELTEKLAES